MVVESKRLVVGNFSLGTSALPWPLALSKLQVNRVSARGVPEEPVILVRDMSEVRGPPFLSCSARVAREKDARPFCFEASRL